MNYVENSKGVKLYEGTSARIEWARNLEHEVAVLRKKNEKTALEQDRIGARALESGKVVKLQTSSTYGKVSPLKGLTKNDNPRLGRKVQQYMNVACPACGAAPGYPCNSSIPLEAWEQENRMHDARIQKVRGGK